MEIIAKKKKAVLYLRYSSSAQTEQSIEGQDRVCREFAKAHDLIIVDSYVDRAKSASKDVSKRTEFLRMIEDSKKGNFEIVLVYKLDRFARDRYDSAKYKSILKKNGVKVQSCTESISDGPEGIIMESMLEGWAEYYSAELSQKIKRGIGESVQKRKFLGGPVPFGLQSVNGRLEPDPIRQPAVEEIFEMILDGFSFESIVKTLNAEGYRTAKGQLLKVSTIRHLVHNKKLIGSFVYDGVEIPNVFEKVIDDELFYSAQRRIASGMKRKKKKDEREEYILTGKLFCGHCKEAMIGDSGKGKTGRVYRYYTCYGRKKLKSGCDKKSIRKDEIEKFVLQKAKDQLTGDLIGQIATQIFEIIDEQQLKIDKLPALLDQQKEIERKIDNLVNVISDGMSSPAILSKLKALESDQVAVQQQIDREKENRRNQIQKQDVVTWLLMLKKDMTHSDQALIDAFIDRVEVYDNENGKMDVEISYKLSGRNESSDIVLNAPPIRKLLFRKYSEEFFYTWKISTVI